MYTPFQPDAALLAACGAEQARMPGVFTSPLREISTHGGPVLHMLRSDHPLFSGFGEIYFSEVETGMTKGWKRHSKQTQMFAVPLGQLSVTLYDTREASPTKGEALTILLGRPSNYRLLRIPPLIWYCFTSIGDTPALLANCADIPHSPDESESRPLLSPGFPAQP